jgi:hypothetical protein
VAHQPGCAESCGQVLAPPTHYANVRPPDEETGEWAVRFAALFGVAITFEHAGVTLASDFRAPSASARGHPLEPHPHRLAEQLVVELEHRPLPLAGSGDDLHRQHLAGDEVEELGDGVEPHQV